MVCSSSSLVLTLLTGLIFPGSVTLGVWAYLSCSYAFFMVGPRVCAPTCDTSPPLCASQLRSLRQSILPETSTLQGTHRDTRKRRIYFLLVVVLIQFVFSYFLIVQPMAR